ncbi:MAG: hypothetical protein ABJH72_04370 [Reichenbachiella sp.]|uniref:hypothetical protein n=1 Tax=Reichenbachiella sp. TaxID=2184521 RepID=UPI0032975003
MKREITIQKVERLYSLLMKRYTNDLDFEYQAKGDEREKLEELIEQIIINSRQPYEMQMNKLIRYFIAHFDLFSDLSATIWPNRYSVDMQKVINNEAAEFWGPQKLESTQDLDEEYESFFINDLGLFSKDLIKYIEKEDCPVIPMN